MRTTEEIVNRMHEAADGDAFGFEWLEYTRAIPKGELARLAEGLIKEDADLSDWEPDLLTEEQIREQCVAYMPFAWDKACSCRGLSALRSMSHYRAWLWLLGEDGFDDISYFEFYGKDHLVRICEFLGLDPAEWDDGIRVNSDEEYYDALEKQEGSE